MSRRRSKRSCTTHCTWCPRRFELLVDAHAGREARCWQGHGGTDLESEELATMAGRHVQLSNDPDFEAKLIDVVGLYMDPPERAVVFSFDEKTQMQALDRTQPSCADQAGPRQDDDA